MKIEARVAGPTFVTPKHFPPFLLLLRRSLQSLENAEDKKVDFCLFFAYHSYELFAGR